MRQWLYQFKSQNNEQGMALVVVLMVLVVISIMGLSIIGLAASNTKMSTGERSSQSAYYIAESGVTSRMNEVKTRLKDTYGLAVNGTDFFTKVDQVMELNNEIVYSNLFEESFGDNPVVKVKIEKLPSGTLISYTNDYKITSTGTINNRSRTVVKTFHISWKPKSSVTIPADTVLFVKDKIELKNVPVDGSIGTEGSLSQITLNGSKAIVSGNIYTNVSTPLVIPAFPIFSIPASATNFQSTSLKMDRDMAFNTFTVNTNSTVVIDVGNSNKSLVVNNLNLSSDGKIKILGSGKLSIYVKNITMGSGSVINTDANIEKLYMFFEGSGSSLNEGIIYGSMFGKDTNFIVNNTSGVQGHLITSGTSIKINGAAINYPKMIFAPNAVVDVNASYSGSIISKSLSSSGNDDSLKFVFVQINYDNSPLFVDNGTGASPVKDMIISEPVREN